MITCKRIFFGARERRLFLDREGKVFHVEHRTPKDRRQNWVTLSSVPDHFKGNLLRIEDRRFESHSGVDFRAIAAALIDWPKSGRLRGASTLSMQLVTLLEYEGHSRSKNVVQKIRQLIRALILETFWTKQEILEAYINLVSFRGDLVGLGAAAKGLFQKEPHGLTREESLILSALLSSPNASPARVASRACRYTGPDECGALQNLSQKHLTQRARLPKINSPALHFTRLFPDTDEVVKTTLDRDIQRVSQEAIQAHLLSLKHQNVKDAAVLVVNHRTNEVLAYVGSSGELSTAPEVDGVRALRQAGSTLKPFLYAKAFEQNLLTPDSLLDDSPFQVQTPHGIYSPENYDRSFQGVVPARIALASSLNIPAVRIIELLSVDEFYKTLSDLGFPLKARQTYGHSLALGAADVSLKDLVSAYGALARSGLNQSIRLIPDDLSESHRIFSTETTQQVTKILSDKDNRILTFGFDNALTTPYATAVKTGTSKDMRDNWCLGYTDTYVVGVWVGNFDGSPMWNVSGVTGAAPIWRTIMDALHPESYKVVTSTPNEPKANHLALREKRGRIIYPVSHTLIAFDPDIPADNQAVVFEHSSDHPVLWELDGKPLADDFILLAQLKSGRHQLRLKNLTNEVLDTVSFEVRGKSSAIANTE